MNNSSGILYIVSTPIGNLKDITLRAVEVLKEVDLIAAEDTRQTKKLLSHYSIRTGLISYYEHNKLTRSELLLKKLKQGNNIALVCNAGTPGICDPGYLIVNIAIKSAVKIVPVPGASAFLCGLQAGGAATDSFIFVGYLPPKTKKRKDRFREIAGENRTVVFYEAPHRLLKSLNDMIEVLGNRKIIITRELTKKFEETRRENISQSIEHFSITNPRGEFVVIIPKRGKL
ncbi:MAG: 16S rRNA (cytidine(1402)-2'-O)-methyltransferase [Candidatus Omnitrophota bacterium]|nr:16S rRNA (cytidine(1402)-2'-O)-methyltransferase [Candidatus Omnitrophota bacterium]